MPQKRLIHSMQKPSYFRVEQPKKIPNQMKEEPYKLPEIQQRFDTETDQKRLKKVQSMSTLNLTSQHLTARK